MADSDNSTSLPFVTHWRTSDITVAGDGSPVDAAKVCGTSAADPAVALAEYWRDAHARTLALCRRQQRLETRLIRKAGYPSCPSADQFAIFERWKRADGKIGYSNAKAAEERSAAVADRLLDQLARTPAQSTEGVIAKLEVILLESEDGDDPSGFPWPHLRSALADLKRWVASPPP